MRIIDIIKKKKKLATYIRLVRVILIDKLLLLTYCTLIYIRHKRIIL